MAKKDPRLGKHLDPQTFLEENDVPSALPDEEFRRGQKLHGGTYPSDLPRAERTKKMEVARHGVESLNKARETKKDKSKSDKASGRKKPSDKTGDSRPGSGESKPKGRSGYRSQGTKDLVSQTAKKSSSSKAKSGMMASLGTAATTEGGAKDKTKAVAKDATKQAAMKGIEGAANAAVPGSGTAVRVGAQVLMNKRVRQGIAWGILSSILILVSIIAVPSTSPGTDESLNSLIISSGDPALAAAAQADEEAAAVASKCWAPDAAPAKDSALAATGGGLYTPSEAGKADAPAQVSGMKPNQVMHAQEIVAVAAEMGLGEEGARVGLAVGKIESQYVNLANDGTWPKLGADQPPAELRKSLTNQFSEGSPRDHGYNHGGDHGSIGIMQQQYPWWGDVDQLLNGRFAARAFFEKLEKIPNWRSMDPAQAAQQVQRSGDASGSNYRQQLPFVDELLPKIRDTKVGYNWSRYQGTPSGKGDPKPGDDIPNISARKRTSGASTSTQGSVQRTPYFTSDGEEVKIVPVAGRKLDTKPGIQEKNQNLNTVRGARVAAHRWPSLKTIGGYRAGDPQDHGKGNAADIMIPDWQGEGRKTGDEIAKFFEKNAKELNVSYVIWRQKIFQPSAGPQWNPMDDRGAPTENHMDHVHVSFLPSAKFSDQDIYDIEASGGSGADDIPEIKAKDRNSDDGKAQAPSSSDSTGGSCADLVAVVQAGSDSKGKMTTKASDDEPVKKDDE